MRPPRRPVARRPAAARTLFPFPPALALLGLLAFGIAACGDRSAPARAPTPGREPALSGGAASRPSASPSTDLAVSASALPAGADSAFTNAFASAVSNPDLAPDLVLVYTASSQGYLEPCGCYAKGKELGGIARRATFVDSLRAAGEPLLLVEGGDFVGGGGPPGRAIGDVTLQAMRSMGYDAVALGEAELRLGPDWLRRAASGGGPKLVHTNWSHPAVGPAQRDGVMVEKGGLKIGLIGLLDPKNLPPDLGLENLTVEPPGPAAATAAASLRKAGADLVLVLGHADFRESGRILVQAGAPDLWVVGHGGKELSEPQRVGGTLLLGAGNGGKLVGALGLRVAHGERGEFANLLYPLHLTIAEQPKVAAIVKSLGPALLHGQAREPAPS